MSLALHYWMKGAHHCWNESNDLYCVEWNVKLVNLYIVNLLYHTPCAQLPGPVHTAWLGRVCFCVFSLGLCFVYSFLLFDLFVCPHSFMFPWTVESSPIHPPFPFDCICFMVMRQEAQLMLTNPRNAFRGQSRSPNSSIPYVRYSFLLCNSKLCL